MLLLTNFLAFQVGWFAAVLGAANGLPWAGPLVIAGVIGVHLWVAPRPLSELALIAVCGAIGAVMDSALVWLGWVSYPTGMIIENAAPYWIVAMWMLFATTLNISLGWLKERKALGMLLGLLGGPLSYYTGFKLGGIELVNMEAAIVALGVGWAAMVPLLLKLADRFNGMERPAVSPVPLSSERMGA